MEQEIYRIIGSEGTAKQLSDLSLALYHVETQLEKIDKKLSVLEKITPEPTKKIKELKEKQKRFMFEHQAFTSDFEEIQKDMEKNIKKLNLFVNCDNKSSKYDKRKHEISILQDENGNLIVAYHKKGMKFDTMEE